MMKGGWKQAMATATLRMLVLIFVVRAGFGKLLVARADRRRLSDLVVLLAAVELSLFAVIRPDEPFLLFLIPLLFLMFTYRISLLLNRLNIKWAVSRPDVQTVPALPVQPPVAVPLVESGKVRADNLKKIGKTQLWLRRELHRLGVDLRRVNYLTIDWSGSFYIDFDRRMPKN
jgi:hypothetical protein